MANHFLADLYNSRKSAFIKNVAIIAGGTAAAQLLAAVFSPVITRLYGPEAFGILGVFIAIITIIVPISSLAYANAIVIPFCQNDARDLAKLSFLITILIFIIITLIISMFHVQIARLVGFNAAAIYLLLVPPVVLLVSCENILKHWLIRNKQFKPISAIAVVQAAGTGAAKSAIGIFNSNAPMLIIITSLGYLLNVILLWLKSAPTLTNNGIINFKKCFNQIPALKKVAYDFRDYPLFNAPQNLIFFLSANLPILMLAAFLGPAHTGFYALAMRVLTLPFALVAHSIGTVFLQRIAEASNRKEKLQPQIIKATGGLAFLGLFPFGLVIAFGPWLFSLVFGSEWVVAGEYSRWLAILVFFSFINVPSIQSIPVLVLQRYKFIFEILSTVVYVGTLAYGGFILKSDKWAIALFSVGGAALNTVLIISVILLSRTRTR